MSPVPATIAQEGLQVTYGVRPEHIEIGNEGVMMNVIVVEPTGSETQIFAKFGCELVDTVVKDRIMAMTGSEIGFAVYPVQVHLFDRKSEHRI